MMMKQIVIICVFLIILMPMSLAQNGICTIEDCSYGAEGWEASEKNAIDDFSGDRTGCQTIAGRMVCGGKDIAAPKPEQPDETSVIRNLDGSTTHNVPGNPVNAPHGTYPSTAGTGGAANQMFQAALGQIQSIMQLVGSLDLKTLIAEKPKPDPGYDPSPTPSPNIPNYIEIAGNTATMGGNSAILYEEKDGDRGAVITSKDKSIPGETTTKGPTLQASTHRNTETALFSGGMEIATVETPNDDTEIFFNPSSETTVFTGTITALIISLLESNFVSAQTQESQYVRFEKQNIDSQGHDINVILKKPFEVVSLSGNKIKITNGENEFIVTSSRSYITRLLRDIPEGVRFVKNTGSPNGNIYTMKEYTNRKGEIYDQPKIVHITDITATHPTKDLMITQHRLDTMFS